MTTILVWILVTLGATTFAAYLGRKFESVVFIGLYTALVLMAQIFAGKLVVFGPFIVPGAVVVYAITYLMTDALVEFYGREEAKKAVYMGLIGSLMLVLGTRLVLWWEPASFFMYQEAFEIVLGNTWRIVLASLTSYLISQMIDVYLFSWFKEKTKGKHLWLRNNASTMISQIFDTIIFIGLAFYGTMPLAALLMMMVGQYVVKFIIALMDTPFIYLMRFIFQYESKKKQKLAG